MTVDYKKDGVAADTVKYGTYNAKGDRKIPVVEGVNLAAIVQDNARYVKDGETKLVYVQFMLHPDDPTAKNQSSLSLMEHDKTYKGETKPDYSVALTPDQYDALVAAAGDNVTPKLDKDGKPTGQVFGVKASVFQKSSKDENGGFDRTKPHGFMPISATFEPSELPVAAKTKRGKDAITRGFELAAANREVRAKAAAEAKAAAKEVEAPEVEAPQAEVEPELV